MVFPHLTTKVAIFDNVLFLIHINLTQKDIVSSSTQLQLGFESSKSSIGSQMGDKDRTYADIQTRNLMENYTFGHLAAGVTYNTRLQELYHSANQRRPQDTSTPIQPQHTPHSLARVSDALMAPQMRHFESSHRVEGYPTMGDNQRPCFYTNRAW